MDAPGLLDRTQGRELSNKASRTFPLQKALNDTADRKWDAKYSVGYQDRTVTRQPRPHNLEKRSESQGGQMV